MGCGCGRNKRKKRQSSRMPMTGSLDIKKKQGPPPPMTNNQRRSAVAKARNSKIMKERKNG